MIQYYWKKTHPRRRKGEVSVNTERKDSVSNEENVNDVIKDNSISKGTLNDTVSKQIKLKMPIIQEEDY